MYKWLIFSVWHFFLFLKLNIIGNKYVTLRELLTVKWLIGFFIHGIYGNYALGKTCGKFNYIHFWPNVSGYICSNEFSGHPRELFLFQHLDNSWGFREGNIFRKTNGKFPYCGFLFLSLYKDRQNSCWFGEYNKYFIIGFNSGMVKYEWKLPVIIPLY